MPDVLTPPKTGVIEKAYILPGLPHLVHGNGPWLSLKGALQKVGDEVTQLRPDVLVIYSAQWVSVLGHSFQYAANPNGYHVDDNWYAMGDFPFSFQVDKALTEQAEIRAKAKGLATKLVDYEGFPIDTGTLVTLHYLNPRNQIPVMVVSSNIYCDQQESFALGQAVREAIQASGKRAVVINCSSLSHHFFTKDIDTHEDRISKSTDDEWNRKMLALIEAGENQKAFELGPEYAKSASPEMMFKGFYWLMGTLNMTKTPGKVRAYGPIWGTGAAIVEYPCPDHNG